MTKEINKRTKIDRVYKNKGQCYIIFESGRFSLRATPTEKEIGRQIVTCKLVHEIELTNWADNDYEL